MTLTQFATDQARGFGPWTEPPLTPDSDTARTLLESELKNSIYQQGESWISRILMRIQEWLMSLTGPSLSMREVVVVLVICALLIAAVFLVAGPVRRVRKAQRNAPIFSQTILSSQEYVSSAHQSAAAGDFKMACAEYFRALIRSAEEQALITQSAGRTAVEAAQAISTERPMLRAELDWAANLFNEVEYGSSSSNHTDLGRLQAIHADLTSTRTNSQKSSVSNTIHVETGVQ